MASGGGGSGGGGDLQTQMLVDRIRALEARALGDESDLDTAWTVLTGLLIFFMQAGFTFVEAGSVRARSSATILLMNVANTAFGFVAWYLVGFALFSDGGAFGGGRGHFALSGSPDLAFFFAQGCFCVSASTIVSGALLERTRFQAYILFVLAFDAVVYPLLAHWAWAPRGWLHQRGYRDFAGSSVVHVAGGAAAFVGAVLVGPRLAVQAAWRDAQRADSSAQLADGPLLEAAEEEEDEAATTAADMHGAATRHARSGSGSEVQMTSRAAAAAASSSSSSSSSSSPASAAAAADALSLARVPPAASLPHNGHSLALAAIGCFILWAGWLAFNINMAHAARGGARLAGKVAANTVLSGAAAAVTFILFFLARRQAVDVWLLMNGTLTGFVAVTGPCAYVQPWAAIVLGVGSVFVFLAVERAVRALQVDDPISVTAVHWGGGVWGTLALGFLHSEQGALRSDLALLGEQALGLLAINAWVVGLSLVVFKLADAAVGLRVSAAEEQRGLDSALLSWAYPELAGLEEMVLQATDFEQMVEDAATPKLLCFHLQLRREGQDALLDFLLAVNALSDTMARVAELASDTQTRGVAERRLRQAIQRRAECIYQRYLMDGAPRPVQLSSHVLRQVRRSLYTLPRGLFDAAHAEISQTLKGGAYARFQRVWGELLGAQIRAERVPKPFYSVKPNGAIRWRRDPVVLEAFNRLAPGDGHATPASSSGQSVSPQQAPPRRVVVV
jgi:ammonia channel protein AmtB